MCICVGHFSGYGIPSQYNGGGVTQKGPNVLSQCHTKRRMGVRGRGHRLRTLGTFSHDAAHLCFSGYGIPSQYNGGGSQHDVSPHNAYPGDTPGGFWSPQSQHQNMYMP